MTFIALAYVGTVAGFLKFLDRERQRQDTQQSEHRREVAELNQARIEETHGLLQRIQSPDTAVAQHAGAVAPPDPAPLSLEDDAAMLEAYEERMRNMGLDVGAVSG